MKFCGKPIPTRANSKYDPQDLHRCQLPDEHTGKCQEYPYLSQLAEKAPKVKNKVVRDATKTTGAAWKGDDAGPNRISRWVMTLSDEELFDLGIDMTKLKPGIVAKLREKAASYDDCMASAKYLAYLVYGMKNAPEPDAATRQYLEALFGPILQGTTSCLICKVTLDFSDFSGARRGRAEIETAHAQPRLHTPGNIGFAHRDCNIAQGDKTLPQFYAWIEGILKRLPPSES